VTPGKYNFSLRPGVTFGPYVFTLLDEDNEALDLAGYEAFWEIKDKANGTPCPVLPSFDPIILTSGSVGNFTADASTDFLTLTAHGLVAGIRVQFTTSGTLPAGLALLTDYYIINDPAFPLTANTFQVSAAPNDDKVDITTTGSGTHTVSITAGQILIDEITDETSHDWENYSGSHDLILEDPGGKRIGPFISGSFKIAAGITNPAEGS
jgi:hypothetical protein